MSDALEKELAPGNASALRSALESIEDDCRVLDRKDMWEEEGECYYDALRDIREKVSAALATPPEPSSNAAAMREAMERIVNCVLSIIGSQHVEIIKFGLEEIKHISRAAISAPARNVDRFKTLDEAREAFQNLRGHKILADVELWDSMDEAGALVRWLFAPAQGGAE